MKLKPYPKYKPSGVEWLGAIAECWNVSPLKYLVSTPITDGPHETPEIFDVGVPFVSAEAVSGGRINFDKIRGCISEEDHKRFSRKYKPQLGDIYLIKSGATTGRVAMVETNNEFNIWSPLAAIRCNPKLVDRQFLFFYMQSSEFQTGIALSWSFGTQQNIGMGIIQNLRVPVPTVTEQRSIAAFLDRETGRIDRLVAKKRELIERLKEKRTALISRTVTRGLPLDEARAAGLPTNPRLKPSGIDWLGNIPEHWEVKRLGFLCVLESGESITSEVIAEGGDFPVYGGNGFRGYYHQFTHDGQFVLIGRQGALCGNINYGNGKFWASEHALIVIPTTQWDVVWMGELLRSMNLGRHSVTAAQPGLAAEMLRRLRVPVPPRHEQTAIAKYLNAETTKLDALVTKVEEAIERLQEYRTALITAAVTGKIDVREEVA